jgi:hypothetical protein
MRLSVLQSYLHRFPLDFMMSILCESMYDFENQIIYGNEIT